MSDDDIKLAFRPEEDEEGARYVRCYISSMDDTTRVVLGSMATHICEHRPALFEKWKDLMQEAFTEICEDLGFGRPTKFTEFRKEDKN